MLKLHDQKNYSCIEQEYKSSTASVSALSCSNMSVMVGCNDKKHFWSWFWSFPHLHSCWSFQDQQLAEPFKKCKLLFEGTNQRNAQVLKVNFYSVCERFLFSFCENTVKQRRYINTKDFCVKLDCCDFLSCLYKREKMKLWRWPITITILYFPYFF